MTQAQALIKKLSRVRGADYDDTPRQPVPVGRRRRGRPEIELKPEMVRIACVMARYGATDVEIAKELGISEKSFYTICGREPAFLQAVRESKDVADERVQNSMYRLATGYNYETEKVFANGLRVTVTEHVPPNPAAGMNWMRNRRNWRTSDNVAQDAIDAVNKSMPDEAPSTKVLAMAAIALITAAATPGASDDADPTPHTIDITPNADPEEFHDDRDEGFDL